MESLYGKRNPNYKENIRSLILSKNNKVQMLDADIIRKSGKNRMVISMIDENGHKFSKTLEKLKHDKYLCCKQCARKMFDEDRYKQREKSWIDIFNQSGYKLLYLPDHITSDSLVEVEDQEGYRYISVARSIKDKNSLLRFSQCVNKKYLLYNLNLYKAKNYLCSTPIEIVQSNTFSHIVCLFQCECGKYFQRSINKWMMGRDVCLECANFNSSYERAVEKYLLDQNIIYRTEFTFYNCRMDNPLPFDFWLKDYNALIEIDGQQHFQVVDYGSGLEIAKQKFQRQQKSDQIKNEYCQQHQIPLLRIPYWEFDNNNWINLLNNFINSLRSNDS